MKLYSPAGESVLKQVAPRTGAWIETSISPMPVMPVGRRPPHGGVD